MSATIYDFTRMVKLLKDPPNRLREQRKAAGITQEALGAAIGINKNQVSRLETGERELSLPRMRQIARVLGIAPGDLLNQEDSGLSPIERETIDAMRADERVGALIADQARGLRSVAETPRDFTHAPATVTPLKAS